MPFRDLPEFAAWQHRDARDGFEVVFMYEDDHGHRLEGVTAAVEEGEAWAVQYWITVGPGWVTRSARASGRSASRQRELTLEAHGAGRWRVNGEAAPHIDGCLDVDFESSALTNTLPVHRLRLEIGQAADAPAAYVRAGDLSVERLEQRYVRLEDGPDGERYGYTAPRFEYEGELRYDEFGLVVEYPGIAVRRD